MNKKLRICIYSSIDWDFLWQRPQALAAALSTKGYEVFFIEPPSSMVTKLKVNKKINSKVRYREIQDGLTIVTPPDTIFPFTIRSRFGIFKDIDRRRFSKVLKEKVYPIKGEDVLHIISSPIWWDDLIASGHFGEGKVIYDCFDDYPKMLKQGKYSEIITEKEKKLITNSNLCLVTSTALKDKIHGISKEVEILKLPNGVEFNLYNTTAKIAGDIPNDISNIKGVKIGFVGAIGNWIDFDIIHYAANRMKDFHFIFVGPVTSAEHEKISNLKNVYFVGTKSRNDVPKYIKNFDVCIVPFKRIDRLDTINSNKFYQYMALGKPIVSVDMKEARCLSDYILTYESQEDFVKEIKYAMASDTKEKQEQRIAYAKRNSWINRAEKLIEKIRI
ncbi:hypothetical protein A6E25_22455 [Bacillus cereus]|nr:hypothetical protein A6E25_22455 [Bacillus cereus]